MMPALSNLGSFVFKNLLDGATRTLGIQVGEHTVGSFVSFFEQRLTDHGLALTSALAGANDRAWKAVEIALAAESMWQLLTKTAEERGFANQLRLYLDSLPRQEVPDRACCLQEIQKARAAGLLALNRSSADQLAAELGHLARYANPGKVLEREREALGALATSLDGEGYPALGRLLRLQPQPDQCVVVVAMRYFFRRAVESDEKLNRAFMVARWEGFQQAMGAGFSALHEALDCHADQIETLLSQAQRYLVETHGKVHEIDERLVRMEQLLQELLRRHRMEGKQVQPQYSFSIQDESSRREVDDLFSQFRRLPRETQHQAQGLQVLKQFGILQFGAGDAKSAGLSFQEVADNTTDAQEKGLAHFNRFRALLEQRAWAEAMQEYNQAVQIEPHRYSLFPADRYLPQRILGAGGFGITFHCKDRRTGGDVAVKVLTLGRDGSDLDNLFREAVALDRINHPHIVKYRDHGYASEAEHRGPYLVLEYCAGEPLDEHVTRHSPLSPDDYAQIARQIADALRVAHARGVLHRDVKPANIMVDRSEGRWHSTLIDFGLAIKHQTLRETIGGRYSTKSALGRSAVGTIDYAAPEQIGKLDGVPVGKPADVYGFGRTTYFALLGKPHPKRVDFDRLPKEWLTILEKCTEDEPRDRFADFSDVLAVLTTQCGQGQAREAAAKEEQEEQLAWLAAQEENTVEEYQRFLVRFSRGVHREQARERLAGGLRQRIINQYSNGARPGREQEAVVRKQYLEVRTEKLKARDLEDALTRAQRRTPTRKTVASPDFVDPDNVGFLAGGVIGLVLAVLFAFMGYFSKPVQKVSWFGLGSKYTENEFQFGYFLGAALALALAGAVAGWIVMRVVQFGYFLGATLDLPVRLSLSGLPTKGMGLRKRG